jgi:hypothetical protein
MSYLSRVPNPGGSSEASPVAPPGEWGTLYPALVEFLSLSQWPEGDARVLGTLTLFVELGQWKASLNDRDQHRVAFCTALTPVALLTSIEEGLVTNGLDWRVARVFSGKNGKKGA